MRRRHAEFPRRRYGELVAPAAGPRARVVGRPHTTSTHSQYRPEQMRFNGTAFNRITRRCRRGVNLNGVATTTDASGRFEVKVPGRRASSERRQAGIRATSRIFYALQPAFTCRSTPTKGAVDGSTGAR